jgi:hypothetical protein
MIEIKEEISESGGATPREAPFRRRRKVQKPMCRQHFATRGSRRTPVRFILPSLPRRHSLVVVTVRILHVSSMMCSRSISGSLLQWRISGASQIFPEQSQTRVVVDSHRGVAARRRFASRILPSVRFHEKKFTRWLQHLAGEEATRELAAYQVELRRGVSIFCASSYKSFVNLDSLL